MIDGNPPLAEMRCHDLVWKRDRLPEHVGFQQYRRWFVIPTLDLFWEIAHRDPGAQTIPCDRAAFVHYAQRVAALPPSAWRWLEYYDVVCPRPLLLGTTMGRQYQQAHRPEDWEVFAHLMRKEGLSVDLPHLVAFNMFIMSARLFGDYMTLWTRIVGKAQEIIAMPPDGPQHRVFGFLSERLFTAWLYRLRCERPMLRVLNLPVLFCPEMSA